MKVLVTGGAGFIGSHLVDTYISAGHEVTIIDNLTTGQEENVNPDARLLRIDIRDRDAVEVAFREGRFDLMNHHAAQLDVRVSVGNPQFDAEQNIIGSLNLFQAALETGVERVVFASSGGTVYGEQEYFPADERHPLSPISPYGVSKLSVEKYLHYYHYVHGLRYVVVRYTNVYGPRQNAHGEAGVVAIFCNRMLAGEGPTIYGSGEQTRDYVYVGDVARGNLLATEHLERADADTFNLCTNTETTVNTLFSVLNGMFDNRYPEEHGPSRAGEQFRSVCTYRHAEEVLGWSPRVGLEEGLGRTLEFFRERSGR